jgi:lipopolysaccharide export system protein LptA
VVTETPGQLEFLPNHPGQRHRTLDCERLTINYGAGNRIQAFNAVNASTHTDPLPPKNDKPAGPPVLTTSKNLGATFDPKTGKLARLEQWDDFRYEEGPRRARSQRAILEEGSNTISLEQAARVWDDTGSTTADHILLDQKSGDMSAQGNVVSSRMPDNKGKSSSMLSTDEPLQATAARMKTSEHNHKVHYEGQAVAWQGANRIWADQIDIDRTAHTISAKGNVRTQFVDQKKDSKSAPTFVTIEAAAMVYSDTDRLAHYTGGAHLVRAGMDVKASEIRAWLNDRNAESSLDRAFADGQVHIVRREPDRTLDGVSEHAEYYTADQRIVLNGGQPQLVDTVRGATRGRQLTYYANDDKLLVDGAEKEPVVSRIRRAKTGARQ